MLLRYGWGLDPKQVCGLVANLSPRAYRKEISRGVDELTEKMRAVERGEWCADREPVLKAYVSGLASADQERQAKAHLAHCRDCSSFVARLSGHLHEFGGALAAISTLEGIGGHTGLGERAVALLDRARETTGGLLTRRDPAELGDAASTIAASGAARGGGVAGAGLFAQIAGAGAAGKAALVCLGGGVAATACVAAGVAPFALDREEPSPAPPRVVSEKPKDPPSKKPTLTVETLPSQVGHETPPVADPPTQQAQVEASPADGATSEPKPVVSESTPAVEQEFGVAAAAPAPAPAAPAPAPTSDGSISSGGGSEDGASAVHQEFGP
jgi:hypothetical protein